MGIENVFQQYFDALDRSGNADRCYLCRRTPADVKAFFGFDEDGNPLEAEEFGLEDVVLDRLDIMSYSGIRPICAVCQLNFDAIFMLEEHKTLRGVLAQMENQRDLLWPESDVQAD